MKLITQNPTATIVCVSPGWSADQTPAIKLSKVNAIKECAEMYGCKFINLYTDCGINSINQTTYIADGVHPNQDGGNLIGNVLAKSI